MCELDGEEEKECEEEEKEGEEEGGEEKEGEENEAKCRVLPYKYRANAALDGFFRHQQVLWENIPCAFPATWRNGKTEEMRQYHAFRLRHLSPLQKKLRFALQNEESATRVISHTTGVDMPFSFLKPFLGRLLNEAVLINDTMTIVVGDNDIAELDTCFPPTAADLASNEKMHPFFGHREYQRWYVAHSCGGSNAQDWWAQVNRLQDIMVTYHVRTGRLSVRGSIIIQNKDVRLHEPGADGSWNWHKAAYVRLVDQLLRMGKRRFGRQQQQQQV